MIIIDLDDHQKIMRLITNNCFKKALRGGLWNAVRSGATGGLQFGRLLGKKRSSARPGEDGVSFDTPQKSTSAAVIPGTMA